MSPSDLQQPNAIIGETPIIELTQFDLGPCRLFAKLECNNPSGSIKDRSALYMIKAAERAKKIQPGDRLIECTAGNTGISLAQVAIPRGYQLTCFMPDCMSQNKIDRLQQLGATVELTRSDVASDHPQHFFNRAKQMQAAESGCYFIDQFNNPANTRAHFETTGPELYHQLHERIDTFVGGMGTGATLTGIGRYLKRKSRHIDIILADPEGSRLASQVDQTLTYQPQPWITEGMGSHFIPPLADFNVIDGVEVISRHAAAQFSYQLQQREGICSGPSAGAVLAAAVHYCQQQKTEKRVAILIADNGDRYQDTLYNPAWLNHQKIDLSRPTAQTT